MTKDEITPDQSVVAPDAGKEKGQLAPEQELVSDIRPAIGENLTAKTTAETKESRELTPEQKEAILNTLQSRFEAHPERHKSVEWAKVKASLEAAPEKLWTLQQMESTGGEPDVFMADKEEFVIGDCSAESPSGRRDIVFDREAEELLKKKYLNETCNGNAADLVAKWAAEFMDEEQYRNLQTMGGLDGNSWSWLKTPDDIRKTGEALNGLSSSTDVRVYGDAAHSHDGGGAFRCALRVNWV